MRVVSERSNQSGDGTDGVGTLPAICSARCSVRGVI